MIVDLRKLISASLIPVVVLVAILLFSPQLNKPLPDDLSAILPFLPYIIFITGMVLSWMFHHSREFNLFLLFIILYIALEQYVWDPDKNVDNRLAYLLLIALIPVNYLFNFLLKERGILNQYGIRRMVFLAIQLFLIAWVLENPYPPLKQFLTQTYSHISYFKLTPISQPLLIALAVTALILIIRLLQTSSTLVAGITGSFIAVTASLHFAQQEQLATIFIITAGMLMIIAITINAYSLAYLDELTNLPSRRALRQNTSSLGKRYCIAMVDVDHFKKFNDKYGHDIGDQVLKKLAGHLRQVRGGKAFRYGGEEFTVLFPNKDLHEARMICNELCKKVEKNPFMLRNKKRPKQKPGESNIKFKLREAKPLKITISIGLAERTEQLFNAEDVIKKADKALYKAKANGRNQVSVLSN